MKRWSTEDFQISEATLYDPIILDLCHHKFVPTHIMFNSKSGP